VHRSIERASIVHRSIDRMDGFNPRFSRLEPIEPIERTE
tara:strand:- start:319 stop:435 length:117 start_codon:yes stop_codon:yes gene_type:complete